MTMKLTLVEYAGGWTAEEPSSQGTRVYRVVPSPSSDGSPLYHATCEEHVEEMYGGLLGSPVRLDSVRIFPDPHEGWGQTPEDALRDLFANHGW